MSQTTRPRLAILGSRGIPAAFGGFETFAEQLAVHLVQLGWEVTVFCETTQAYRLREYKGVQLRYVPTPRLVGIRSLWFDSIGVLLALRGYDTVYMLGYHAAFIFVLPHLLNSNFWVNMDGLEWRRTKWSPIVRRYLKSMEFVALRLAPHIVADAHGIAEHLRDVYPASHSKIHVIAYGTFPVSHPPDPGTLPFPLLPGRYYLVVCRFEPENHVLEIIRGFLQSKSPYRLVLVGDDTVCTPYVRALRKLSSDTVRFLGTIFDRDALTALRYHCRAYLHGHSVGGTNPSLLESMACANVILAHDNPFNREVTSNLCFYFGNSHDISTLIQHLEREGDPSGIGMQLARRAANHYDWRDIAEAYHRTFRSFHKSKTGPKVSDLRAAKS